MIRALTLAMLTVLLMSCQGGMFSLLQGDDATPAQSTDAVDTDAGTDPPDAALTDAPPADAAETSDAPDAAPAPPRAASSAAQTACEARGGRFVGLGDTGARVCQTRTRDANKICTASSQCEGACLARSATCAPVKPLLGCNDVITDNGGMATVCID